MPVLLMVVFALTRWPGVLPPNFSAAYVLAFCAGVYFFFFNDTATTEIYTLSLHDALPISRSVPVTTRRLPRPARRATPPSLDIARDRKSTRLNSSHVEISYAVFCLKK